MLSNKQADLCSLYIGFVRINSKVVAVLARHSYLILKIVLFLPLRAFL